MTRPPNNQHSASPRSCSSPNPSSLPEAQHDAGWQYYHVTLARAVIGTLCETLAHSILFDHVPDNPRSHYLIFSAEGQRCQLDEVSAKQSDIAIPAALAALPFVGGYAGFLSYDYGEKRLLKQQGCAPNTGGPKLADYQVCHYGWAYIEDKAVDSGYLVFSPQCQPELKAKVLKLINKALKQNLRPQAPKRVPAKLKPWQKDQSYAHYQAAFTKVGDYILAGDIYQANLTQRYSTKAQHSELSSWQVYEALGANSNGHYGGFLKLSASQSLLSFSPEQFISIAKRKVITKPIKGTSDIASDPDAHRLKNSVKDRAENLMIVDLMRNDLSRVCKPHSVNTTKLFDIERYRKLNHLVSTIEGELAEHCSELDAFLACFPGGSITGAPKIRAMEVIQELERQPRSAYCGSMFYLSEHGRFDSNILIRSIVQDGEDYYCWSGGGIVADSELESEYQESLNKVQHLTGIEV